ncbi:hypothetical protein CHF27_007445 [Romboutsia maritimum]|uniref:Uncharacterized protein n=1 Tax=Romboutsia maritimum TaxID=2020948 RepID=A0A371IT06_9FIRM|nr:hypothetical protein CHF27_007445 [Romboutsia maritimum]
MGDVLFLYYETNKYLYILEEKINKSLFNTIIIYVSIIDYHVTYIYDITIVSGIIIQGVIFIVIVYLEKIVKIIQFYLKVISFAPFIYLATIIIMLTRYELFNFYFGILYRNS